MPTFVLIAPVFVIAVVLFFIAPLTSEWVRWMVPFVFYTILILIFKAQINFWWYSKFPPQLDKQAQDFLNRFFPFYSGLSETNKRLFDSRLTLFNHDKEYLTKDLPSIPGDVMLLTSASAIQITFGFEDYLLKHWGQIILYQKPFHTPKRQYFHSGEVHYEDGCVILAVEPMIEGIQDTKTSYNHALHQFGLALQYENKIPITDFLFLEKEETIDSVEEEAMRQLAKIRGWEARFDEIYIDIPQDELFGVCVEHFFNASESFKLNLPKMYQAMKSLLNQDPQSSNNPRISALK